MWTSVGKSHPKPQKWQYRGDRQHVRPPQEQSSKETLVFLGKTWPCLSAAAQAGAVFHVKRCSPEIFLFPSTASVLMYGPCKAKSAARVFFTSPWKQRRIINGPFLPRRLFILAWEPSTSNRKEPRVKGRAAFPLQGKIQSSSHQWLVNQKMNKKWTRRKTSQELTKLM